MTRHRERDIARVESRFSLMTLLVGTVFCAILFAILRTLQLPWFSAVAVVVFLAGVGAAQTLLRDARRVRIVSMGAGAILVPLCELFTRLFSRVPGRWYHLFGPLVDPCSLVSMGISGAIAGYTGGVLVASIFLVARLVEDFLANPESATQDGERLAVLEPDTRVQLEIARSVDRVRSAVREAHSGGLQIALVPTMGALHEGHLSLIRRARSETGFVVVSIFVNPAQFGPHEDLMRYPRPFEQDVRLCRQERVDMVFAPDVEAMYPQGFTSFVEVEGLSQRMEGAFRPGHFRGVATVVMKLFNIVAPDIAYFGQKDAQQARVIQQMVRDLDVPIRIQVCPTVREPDGLALSSRNQYLSSAERQSALALSRCLRLAQQLIDSGDRDADSVRHKMQTLLESAPEVRVDYAELVDPITFEPVDRIAGPVLAVVAARVGQTRLIDNLPIEIQKG